MIIPSEEYEQKRLQKKQAKIAEAQAVLGQFLKERCIVEEGQRARASQAHAAYLRWCQDSSPPISLKRFAMHARCLFTVEKRIGSGTFYEGFGLQKEDLIEVSTSQIKNSPSKNSLRLALRRQEEIDFAAFLDACCLEESKIRAMDLYAGYQRWYLANKQKTPMSLRAFALLARREFDIEMNGMWTYYLGISLREEFSDLISIPKVRVSVAKPPKPIKIIPPIPRELQALKETKSYKTRGFIGNKIFEAAERDFEGFMASSLVTHAKDKMSRTSELYSVYLKWKQEQLVEGEWPLPMSLQAFGRRMRRNFPVCFRLGNAPFYVGISLADNIFQKAVEGCVKK